MAQSPEKNAGSSEILRYDLGWNAINAMLRSGRSLSGHERNCCFLNTGTDRFANVSAAAGLDFADDGRVLALADWDYDGDVDVWIANRSGPQVRFLRNNTTSASDSNSNVNSQADPKSKSHFVAVRLTGTRSNRDAIGTRVAVTSIPVSTNETSATGTASDDVRSNGAEGRQPVRQISTLRAGEGYLAQSSKWLHFGIGDSTQIARLEVVWPTGEEQTFKNLNANTFYQVVEGEQEIKRWKPPTLPLLTPSDFSAPPVGDEARIVLLNPIPLPSFNCFDTSQGTVPLTDPAPRPRLINLWAAWCQPCLKELADWKHRADELSAANLDIIAVNVDQPAEESSTPTPQAILDKLELPFQIGFGDEHLAAQFDVIQRSLLSRQRPLPLPSSFLVDADGRLRVVYKGPVDVETLLADTALIGAPIDERLRAATPLPGKWLTPPGGSTPLFLALKLVEGGFAEEAKRYIHTLNSQSESHPEYMSSSILNLLGAIELDQKQFQAAANAFKASLKFDPTNRQAHAELGSLLLQAGQGHLAESHFESLLQNSPDDPELLTKLGLSKLQQRKLDDAERVTRRSLAVREMPLTWWQLGEIYVAKRNAKLAIAAYEAAIRLQPERAKSANNLAWLLATSDMADMRDGARAVELARTIVASSSSPTAGQLDTLSAALAETGDFANAIETATRALRAAKQNNSSTARLEKRLELFKQGRPFHEALK